MSLPDAQVEPHLRLGLLLDLAAGQLLLDFVAVLVLQREVRDGALGSRRPALLRRLPPLVLVAVPALEHQRLAVSGGDRKQRVVSAQRCRRSTSVASRHHISLDGFDAFARACCMYAAITEVALSQCYTCIQAFK